MKRSPLLIKSYRPLTARWHRPDLDEEREEIEDRARDLDIPAQELLTAVASGQLAPLSLDHWRQLQNSDSWETTKMDQARGKAVENGRDVNRILRGMKQGDALPASMVLFRKDHPPYLIGGNTRLMVARALGVTPQVIHARLS